MSEPKLLSWQTHCLATIVGVTLFAASFVAQAQRGGVGETGVQLITVEAQSTYSASGRDDLTLIRRYFQGASWERPLPAQTWAKLRRLGISKIRLINVEAGNMARLDARGNQLRFDFSPLLPGLRDCRKYRLRPHIIVGQRPQDALMARQGGVSFGVADWALYEQYAYALLKFVMVDQGFSQADFEVGNEPDINGASWLLSKELPNADPSMYNAYLQLYRVWAIAADRLTKEHPELKLRLGGPDTTSFTFAFGKFNWADRFAKDVGTQRLRLNFFSFHFYGNNGALSGSPTFGRYPSFAAHVQQTRSNLMSAGLGAVPIYVTEWGPSYVTKEVPEGIINGDNVGGAWTARFLLDMAASNIDEGMALTLRDNIDANSSANNWGWPSFLLSDGVTPKALYNVCLMFIKLPGKRVKVSPLSGSVGAIASADRKSVGILIFNQDWDFPLSRERAKTVLVDVRVNLLPFSTPHVNATRYLVDASHGNAYYSHMQKLPIEPATADLRQVERVSITARNGVADLPRVALAPSAVTLWTIAPEHKTRFR